MLHLSLSSRLSHIGVVNVGQSEIAEQEEQQCSSQFTLFSWGEFNFDRLVNGHADRQTIVVAANATVVVVVVKREIADRPSDRITDHLVHSGSAGENRTD